MENKDTNQSIIEIRINDGEVQEVSNNAQPIRIIDNEFGYVTVTDYPTAKTKQCDHDWQWSYDCFEDAVTDEGCQITIPVKCTKCGAEGRQVYKEMDVIANPDTE